MKISVAMAAYNGERFIGAQVESLLGQTLPPDEIVICDDSADDATERAVAAVTAGGGGVIRYCRNPVPLGVSRNFEKAIGMTSGDIVFIADQDDVWLPDKIEKLAGLISACSEPVGAFCNSLMTDANLQDTGIDLWSMRGFSAADRLAFMTADKPSRLRRFARIPPASGHNMAFDARLKELILPFPDLPECHDTWIGLLVETVTPGWRTSAEKLTLFRRHDRNVSLTGKVSMLQQARASIANNTFSWHKTLFDELIRRLAGRDFPCGEELIAILRDRRDHSAARTAMNRNFFIRLPLIFNEIRNQRYFRYGRGWLSVIQDLLLRPPFCVTPKRK